MEIALGLDNDHEAALTFRRNFPKAIFIENDIRKVSATGLDVCRASRGNAPLVLAACAPCQPFSKQNRDRKEGDDRVSLLTELGRFIRRFRPDYIFVENVPGMQYGCLDGQPFQEFVALLLGCRYHISYEVVQALHYGVPQHRERLILTASRLGEPGMPPPTHGPGLLPFVTVGDTIGRYPPCKQGSWILPSPTTKHAHCRRCWSSASGKHRKAAAVWIGQSA